MSSIPAITDDATGCFNLRAVMTADLTKQKEMSVPTFRPDASGSIAHHVTHLCASSSRTPKSGGVEHASLSEMGARDDTATELETTETKGSSHTKRNERKVESCKSQCATLPCSDDDHVNPLRGPSSVDARVRTEKGKEETTQEKKPQQDSAVFDSLLQSHQRLMDLLGPASTPVERSRSGGVRIGEYRLIQRIGKGTYGEVWEARCSSKPKSSRDAHVAIKVIPKSSYTSKKRMDLLADEVSVMKHVSNKNVISAKEVLHGTEHIFVVMELGQMNLTEYRDDYGDELNHTNIRTILKGVLGGLTYLHCHGIAHMDLKFDNIMILRDVPPKELTPDDIRICDLGFALIGENGLVSSGSRRGTMGLMAPEVYTASEASLYDATSADMWSLGVLLLDLTGRTPHSWMDLFKKQHSPIFGRMLNKKINSLHSRLKSDHKIDSQLVDLMVRMLDVTPSGRLTAHEALNHAWVSQPEQQDPFQFFLRLLRPR